MEFGTQLAKHVYHTNASGLLKKLDLDSAIQLAGMLKLTIERGLISGG